MVFAILCGCPHGKALNLLRNNFLSFFINKNGTLFFCLEKFVTIDKNLYRPIDLEIIYGDNSEAMGKLGWNYDMSFDQLMNKLIEDEIQYVKLELQGANASSMSHLISDLIRKIVKDMIDVMSEEDFKKVFENQADEI